MSFRGAEALAPVGGAYDADAPVAIDAGSQALGKERPLVLRQAAALRNVPPQLDPRRRFVNMLTARTATGGRFDLEFVVRDRETHRLTR